MPGIKPINTKNTKNKIEAKKSKKKIDIEFEYILSKQTTAISWIDNIKQFKCCLPFFFF